MCFSSKDPLPQISIISPRSLRELLPMRRTGSGQNTGARYESQGRTVRANPKAARPLACGTPPACPPPQPGQPDPGACAPSVWLGPHTPFRASFPLPCRVSNLFSANDPVTSFTVNFTEILNRWNFCVYLGNRSPWSPPEWRTRLQLLSCPSKRRLNCPYSKWSFLLYFLKACCSCSFFSHYDEILIKSWR